MEFGKRNPIQGVFAAAWVHTDRLRNLGVREEDDDEGAVTLSVLETLGVAIDRTVSCIIKYMFSACKSGAQCV